MDTGQSNMPKPIALSLPDTQVVPDPILEERTRWHFSTEHKLRILAEADQCKRGELGVRLNDGLADTLLPVRRFSGRATPVARR